jgi:hypothetical protein
MLPYTRVGRFKTDRTDADDSSLCPLLNDQLELRQLLESFITHSCRSLDSSSPHEISSWKDWYVGRDRHVGVLRTFGVEPPTTMTLSPSDIALSVLDEHMKRGWTPSCSLAFCLIRLSPRITSLHVKASSSLACVRDHEVKVGRDIWRSLAEYLRRYAFASSFPRQMTYCMPTPNGRSLDTLHRTHSS